ncbi:hypothetical protein SK128_015533 [Halocaridina rubra]|uniref:Uncharacterized protein n=1 Tax=Halocaridina rubra TaxID=373956 RepID=A0AAN8ZT04_HALRR
MISYEHLTLTDTFDGVSASTYNEGWLLKNSSQKISGNISVTSLNISTAVLNENAEIYGINIARLLTAVKINDTAYFLHEIHFNSISCQDSLIVGGLVQGWNLTYDGIRKSSANVTVTAPKTFVAPVNISKSFKLSGLLNNLNLSAGCSNFDKKTIIVEGNLKFEKSIITEDFWAGNNHINTTNAELFWQSDKDTVINGTALFKHVSTPHINTTLNHIDILNNVSSVLVHTCDDWNIYSENISVNHLVTSKLQAHSVELHL